MGWHLDGVKCEPAVKQVPGLFLGSSTFCIATWRLSGVDKVGLSPGLTVTHPHTFACTLDGRSEQRAVPPVLTGNIIAACVALHAMMPPHQPIGPTVRGTASAADSYADPQGCDVSSKSPAAGGGPPKSPSPVSQWIKQPGLVDIRRRHQTHGQAHIVMAGATREQSVQNDIGHFSLRASQQVSARSQLHQRGHSACSRQAERS